MPCGVSVGGSRALTSAMERIPVPSRPSVTDTNWLAMVAVPGDAARTARGSRRQAAMARAGAAKGAMMLG